MLMMNAKILAKDYKDKIEVDGFDIYDPSTVQFSLYTLVNATDEMLGELNIEDIDNQLLVFPFQCGVKFMNNYHLLDLRDCIGIISIDDIKKAWKGLL